MNKFRSIIKQLNPVIGALLSLAGIIVEIAREDWVSCLIFTCISLTFIDWE